MAAEKDLTRFENVKDLVSLMKDNDLVELEIVDGENKIHLKRPNPEIKQVSMPAAMPMPMPMQQMPQAPAPAAAPATGAAPAAEPAKDENLIEIPSPIVGTFYISPSPDSDPFIKTGDKVDPDTVVCIIEAMKVMNEIKAECSGTIVEILCKAGQAIEYGQVLFKVKPD